MGETQEKRVNYRRYEDRRIALMLAIYEILFDEPDGPERNGRVLEAVCYNYRADKAALVAPNSGGSDRMCVVATAGDWQIDILGQPLEGPGVEKLWSLQEDAPGALTLTSVKRPAVFSREAWESLWHITLGDLASALLSVRVHPQEAPPAGLWILQSSYSREWSSRDRDLAEEVADLLSRARDKDLARK